MLEFLLLLFWRLVRWWVQCDEPQDPMENVDFSSWLVDRDISSLDFKKWINDRHHSYSVCFWSFFCRYRYCPAIVTAGDPVFDSSIFVLLFFFSSYFLFPSVWFDLSVAGTGTFFLGRISGQSQILYPGPDVENNNLDPDPKETMRIQAEGESGRVTILWTGWIRIVSNESGSVIFVLFCRYLGTDPN